MQFLKRPVLYRPAVSALRNRPIALRTTLVVPFVLQVMSTMGLVGFLSYRTGERAMRDLSGQLRQEVTARVEEQVKSYLERPHWVNASNLQLAQQKLLQLDDTAALESYFIEQSKRFNQLETIAYSDFDRKDYVGANGTERYSIVATPDRGMKRYAYGKTSGERGALIAQRSDYAVQNRPWYQTAMTHQHPTWSPINPSPVGQRLDLSAVSPFYEQQTLKGIFVTQISLASISQFLRKLEISQSGEIFILERNGFLVANSSENLPFTPGQSGQAPQRLDARNSSNQTIQATAKYLADRFPALSQIQGAQNLEFELNQEKQFLQVKPVTDPYGIDWLIVVVVPESNFMAQIQENTRNTVILCLIALGLAIAFGIWAAHRITRPLSRIADASQRIAGGELNYKVYPSLIREIAALGQSFNRMALQLKDSFETLEERVKQRTADLNHEKERSEKLLLNILPEPIADQLKQADQSLAEHFDQATILFADIVGFTQLSARLEPMELVSGLNLIFSAFDQLTEKYGLEKIKTIGDAYMVAGGLPLPRIDHATAIAAMALDMQIEMQKFSHLFGVPLSIRIGIHSGPVVAGVIGLRKFSYDLWGDTVNVASRMESHSVPGCIQVSEATYQFLVSDYILESRGTIAIKGRGEMETYWLLDRRACSESVLKDSQPGLTIESTAKQTQSIEHSVEISGYA